MKALLIKPASQSIEPVEIDDMDQIVDLVGYETIIADDVGNNGDRLHFDEECFLRGTEGRFQIDNMIPVSGNGVIVGSNADETLADMKSNADDIKSRIKFL